MAAQMFFAASTGADLLRERRLLDLSLRAVAGEIGISPTTLQRWEASERPLSQQRLTNWSSALERAECSRVAAMHRATAARRYARRVKQEAD
jgi:transcriptional regulator with XRE-family HTH domain